MALTLDHLQQREEHWAIVDLVGKGGHIRTVPVPDWVRAELNDWLTAAAIDRGELFRPGQQSWKDMGRWDDGKGGLAHCEGIRQTYRSWRSWRLIDLRRTCTRLRSATTQSAWTQSLAIQELSWVS